MAETTHNRTEVVKVRVNETELQWLRDTAAAEDRTVSSVLRLALREYYDRRQIRGKRRVRGSA